MVSPSGSYDINIHNDRPVYYQYKVPHTNTLLHKNVSNLGNQKISYMSTTTSTQDFYSNSYNNNEQMRFYNPLQIQPHQQYEHDVMTSGLGGYWKRKENGEMTWCNANFDNAWQRDKR